MTLRERRSRERPGCRHRGRCLRLRLQVLASDRSPAESMTQEGVDRERHGLAGCWSLRHQLIRSLWWLGPSGAPMPSRKSYPVKPLPSARRPCPAGPDESCWLGSCIGLACAALIPNVSAANEIPGRQTGSQRPQAPGYVRPHPATLAAGGTHVRPHRAMPGDVRRVPPKQPLARSDPARPHSQGEV